MGKKEVEISNTEIEYTKLVLQSRIDELNQEKANFDKFNEQLKQIDEMKENIKTLKELNKTLFHDRKNYTLCHCGFIFNNDDKNEPCLGCSYLDTSKD